MVMMIWIMDFMQELQELAKIILGEKIDTETHFQHQNNNEFSTLCKKKLYCNCNPNLHSF